MTYHFNVEGANRKALVQKISEILGIKAKYLGMPSAAYEIGKYTVSKTGEVTWSDLDDADRDFLDQRVSLLAELEAAGFHSDEAAFYEAQLAAMGETFEEPEENAKASESPAETADFDGLSISLPRERFSDAALENLKRLVKAKAPLMKRAFQADELPVEIDDEKVSFPWFTPDGPEEIAAYTAFIAALADMAIHQKRITATAKEIVNEKYEFRCFLLRLGFIGKEHKATRKILLQNLTGSSAFKTVNGEEESEA